MRPRIQSKIVVKRVFTAKPNLTCKPGDREVKVFTSLQYTMLKPRKMNIISLEYLKAKENFNSLKLQKTLDLSWENLKLKMQNI